MPVGEKGNRRRRGNLHRWRFRVQGGAYPELSGRMDRFGYVDPVYGASADEASSSLWYGAGKLAKHWPFLYDIRFTENVDAERWGWRHGYDIDIPEPEKVAKANALREVLKTVWRLESEGVTGPEFHKAMTSKFGAVSIRDAVNNRIPHYESLGYLENLRLYNVHTVKRKRIPEPSPEPEPEPVQVELFQS